MAESEQKKQLMNELMSGQHHSEVPQKSKATKVEWLVRVMYMFQFVLIGFLIYTLTTDGECDEPIRLWLKVLMICFIITTALSAAGCATSLPTIVTCLKILLDLFVLVWYIIGIDWFFEDDTCEQKWHTGYVMAYVLVVFFFLSLVPYVLCCFVIVGAVVGAKNAKKN